MAERLRIPGISPIFKVPDDLIRYQQAKSRILFLGSCSIAGRKMHEAAIEVYLHAARSGSVPTELLAGVPKDPFTGKDFAYQKTEEGFTLTRWTDDDTDWRSQLEFKVR